MAAATIVPLDHRYVANLRSRPSSGSSLLRKLKASRAGARLSIQKMSDRRYRSRTLSFADSRRWVTMQVPDGTALAGEMAALTQSV